MDCEAPSRVYWYVSMSNPVFNGACCHKLQWSGCPKLGGLRRKAKPGRLSLLGKSQVKEDRFDSLPDEVKAMLGSKGLPVVGALPHSAVLGSIRLDEIQTALGADLLRRHSRLDVGVDQVRRTGPTITSQERAWHDTILRLLSRPKPLCRVEKAGVGAIHFLCTFPLHATLSALSKCGAFRWPARAPPPPQAK